MELNVKLLGVEQARARLAEVGRNVDPVLRGALNSTATGVRKQIYVADLISVFKGRQFLNARMTIKRANRARMNARIIPSSSGVEMGRYQSWGFDLVHPTRAVIWVRGLNGRKVAAGFVNPATGNPWRTRSERARNLKRPERSRDKRTSYRYETGLEPALGPSVAYWFRQMTDSKVIRWTNAFLQQEFERRIRREVAKGVR